MTDKLQKLEVPAKLVHWVLNVLSNRPKCVQGGDIKSTVLTSNTAAPQGCVPSPFLYTLYTNDCRSVEHGVAVWVPRETPAPWLVVIHSVSHRFELAVKDTFKGTGADASGNCARPTEPDGCSTRELVSSGERHTHLL